MFEPVKYIHPSTTPLPADDNAKEIIDCKCKAKLMTHDSESEVKSCFSASFTGARDKKALLVCLGNK